MNTQGIRRWAVRGAVAAAVLLVLYAAAGYWLAPRLVLRALEDQAVALGATLTVEKVRTNPFALTVNLDRAALHWPGQDRVAAAQSVHADLPWSTLWGEGWSLDRLSLSGGSLHVVDRSRGVPLELRLEQVALELRDMTTQGAGAGDYELAAQIAGGGTVNSQGALSLSPLAVRGKLAVAALPGGGSAQAQGSVDLSAGRAKLQVQANGVALSPAQRFLPESVAVKIPSGRLSGKGTLTVGAEGKGPAAVYEGTLAIRGLRLEERDSGNLLLAWSAARTAQARLRFAPYSLELGNIEVDGPEGRLVIEPGGNFNFARVFQGGEGAGKGGRFHAGFESLRIAGGSLHLADRSLDNPFEVTIIDLAGSVSGFSTGPAEPARVRLAGRVQPYGSARIRGTIDLNAPASLADITADLRNLRLDDFNPYVAKFAGYRIRSGRVSAKLRYELREGRLVGANQLVFEQMQLGEKLQSKGALDLPLELVVALLADAKGRINLDIPVSGNLNDPTFELGAIVAKAVGNVLRKIVSAPFRALAGLLGAGGRDLGEVAFEAGSTRLTPPAEEDLAQVTKALEERPRLGVRVSGGYDTARDLPALRRSMVRDEISRRAGVDAGKGALNFGDPKVIDAAERLYLQRVGNRLELQKLRVDEPRYARALVEQLAGALPPAPDAAQALGRARAEMVRAALLERGIEPSRVRLDDPAEKPAGREGVPTRLSLTAG